MTSSSDSPGSGIPAAAPSSAWATFLRRGFSTVILLVILLGVYFSHSPWAYLGIFTVFCLVASLEWKSMLRISGLPVCGTLIVLAGVLFPLLAGIPLIKLQEVVNMGQGISLVPGGDGPTSVLITAKATLLFSSFLFGAAAVACIAIYAILAFLWELRRPVEQPGTLLSLGGTLLAFIYPVWMFCFGLPLLFGQPGGQDSGVMTLLWVLLVTKIMDMGAYVSGSLFGKHKMIPHISPKKTWEGFLGACVFTVLAGIGLKEWWSDSLPIGDWSVWGVGALSLFLGLVSVVGDLAGSVIKRALGVKDSGKILPGIGGVYDLIDSPAFTMPVALIIFSIL